MTTPTPDPTGGPSWTAPGADPDPTRAPAPGWGVPPGQPGYPQPPAPPAGPVPGLVPGYGQQLPPVPPGQTPYPQTGGPYPAGPGWNQWTPPAVQPGIVPLRPLTLMEILDGSFRAIRSNPAVMFGLSAVVVVVVIAVSTVLGTYVSDLLSASFSTFAGELDAASAQSFQSSIATSMSSLVTSVAMMLAGPVLTGLLITSVSRSVIGQRLSMSEAWRLTKGRRARLLGFALAIAGAELVVLAALTALVVLVARTGSTAAAVLLGFASLVGYVVLITWVSVRTLLVPASLVLEGTRFRQGIVRGWKLTYGSFWRLFGIYLLTVLMLGVLTSILQVPASILASFLMTMPNMSTVSLIVTAVSMAITETVTVAYLSSVVALLYVDLRIRREGLDVELARAAGEAA
ncbi:hypothetical protein [Cellulomonas sp. P24]|uniref:hypothetical protein n=1 Tax=Cellulomonas sp. P24 TaxID=2885206 RepID=UPI00216AF4AB|nr:hypothetical protein [Cellulomonas sp. P24]MCR6491700.1 hypothetical protein [Cellulomonas sp. P24]